MNNPSDPDTSKLTAREIEILKQLVDGKSNQEIANHLYLSENTVKHNVRTILDKLGVSSRADAIKLAQQMNLVFRTLAGDSTTDAPPPDVSKKKRK